MALYAYKKRKPKIVKPKAKKPFFIPVILFTAGVSVLAYLAYPYLSYYLAKSLNVDTLSKELLSPSSGFVAYAKTSESDSGSYEKNAQVNISTVAKEIQLGNDLNLASLVGITGKMYITIPKLGLKHISVNINTPSDNEDVYNRVLGSNVAHFKGTSLPGNPGKTFLYGHSSRSLFTGSNRTFGSGIFTDIDKLNLGDEFSIEYSGKTFNYSVYKVKLVEKDDLDVIHGDSRKTVSLMTCKPDGIGSSRLIVEALEESE